MDLDAIISLQKHTIDGLRAELARALEIETQELAEALEDMVAIYSEDDIDDEFPALSRARAALARHRAKQPPTP